MHSCTERDIGGQCAAIVRSDRRRYSSDHHWSARQHVHRHGGLHRPIQTLPGHQQVTMPLCYRLKADLHRHSRHDTDRTVLSCLVWRCVWSRPDCQTGAFCVWSASECDRRVTNRVSRSVRSQQQQQHHPDTQIPIVIL